MCVGVSKEVVVRSCFEVKEFFFGWCGGRGEKVVKYVKCMVVGFLRNVKEIFFCVNVFLGKGDGCCGEVIC